MTFTRLFLFAVATLLWQMPDAAADATAETTVKAAVVHKISKFVVWPPESFESDTSPLRFCVAGDPRFYSAITKLAEQTVHGRPLQAKQIQEPAEAPTSCDVLYLGHDPDRDPTEWTASVERKPILTFAETDGYAGKLSIVRVLVRRDRVRFEINLDANAETGLRISGQLLQLAAAVSGRGT